jgi:uncharacterized damage-inducible protein DinB
LLPVDIVRSFRCRSGAKFRPSESQLIISAFFSLRNEQNNFANLARNIAREKRYDDCFMDTLDNPPVKKTFGGAIGHVITHNMHHRAQIMFLMERAGLKNHIEGDLLSWESNSFGWH